MIKGKDSYERLKNKFLNDETILSCNRTYYEEFLKEEEYKLKRINRLPRLDNGCYLTLIGYIRRLKNVNEWFGNVDMKTITEEDIKRVFDDLEDEKILTKQGKPFKDTNSYYNKIFKSTPFEIIGKAHLAKKVIKYIPTDDNEVRFIEIETFRQLVDVTPKILYKFLLWLAFDIGENMNKGLLSLKKSDVVEQLNPDTNEVEYRVNLRNETLKRSRKARSELTNFPETVQFGKLVLKELNDDDLIFPTTYEPMRRMLKRAVEKTKAKCIPKGQEVTFKDLRSSMACHLLKNGWTTDEINGRLGHKASSSEIDKYVNFLAIDRPKMKKKLTDNSIQKLTHELSKYKETLKLSNHRIEKQGDQIEELKRTMSELIKAHKASQLM
jgi:integrase